MNSRIGKAVILCCFAVALFTQANAQGNNGRGKCMQPFGISFYAIKAGYEDEWLGLYMEWHYPLMEYALEQGTLLQHKLFVPAGHGIEAQWTFAASFLYPAAQNQKSATLDRAQQIQKLFGNRIDEYVAGEKRRWELTLSHWDTDFIELDKTESPLSVYLPSAGGCRS
jgi:hypothetical protein